MTCLFSEGDHEISMSVLRGRPQEQHVCSQREAMRTVHMFSEGDPVTTRTVCLFSKGDHENSMSMIFCYMATAACKLVPLWA